jgi:hypothetical protein
MPLTRPIVLGRNGTGGNETFDLLEPVVGGAIYLASTATAQLPYTLAVKHSKKTVKGVGVIDNHLVQVKRTILGADNVSREMIVNWTVQLPRDLGATANQIEDTLGMPGALVYIDAERAAILLGFS